MDQYNRVGEEDWEVGDIVTRDGMDEQEVIEISNMGTLIVKCIKEPMDSWCKLGDEEMNLTSRYLFVRGKK